MSALWEFRLLGNGPLGYNSQSEHSIQQMNPAKTEGQACKAAWVKMGL